MSDPIIIESADGKRIWTITERADGFDCNGLRLMVDGAPEMAGHHHFLTEDAAVAFCRSICGLDKPARSEG